jgi:hypothetical protein
MMTDDRKTDVEKIVEQVLDDPDSPAKGNTDSPQTIDAEPAQPSKDAR